MTRNDRAGHRQNKLKAKNILLCHATLVRYFVDLNYGLCVQILFKATVCKFSDVEGVLELCGAIELHKTKQVVKHCPR